MPSPQKRRNHAGVFAIIQDIPRRSGPFQGKADRLKDRDDPPDAVPFPWQRLARKMDCARVPASRGQLPLGSIWPVLPLPSIRPAWADFQQR